MFAPLLTFGQDKDIDSCKVDTVEMILAYEFDGQCFLDDMIFKTPELVEYRNNDISSKNYLLGVYHFYTPLWTNSKKLNECGININIDSIVQFKNPFHDRPSKIITIRNKSFKGKGTTFLGNEKTKWRYHNFKFKLFKVKFVRVNIGIESRMIVNIDRKSKLDQETKLINCPIYVMIKIIDINEIE